jgi:hypothetical protein
MSKRVKYHLAASLYYLINFDMPVVKKESKLASGLLDAPNEYDALWDDMQQGFKENYFNFETIIPM